MVGVVLGQQLDQTCQALAVQRQVGHVLIDFRTKGANGILKTIIAVCQPLIPVLSIEQDGGTIDRVTNECGGVHVWSPIWMLFHRPRRARPARAAPTCRSKNSTAGFGPPCEFAIIPQQPTSVLRKADRDCSAAGSSTGPTLDSSAACRSR